MGKKTKKVRSFDLFDTLIARLHHRPDSIFDEVEKNFPFPGFSFFRKAAELKSDGTLPDIYRQFQEMTDIGEERSASLMQFELETELAQVYPIVENLDLVKDGDLIVTDTYYNEPQIRMILEKIGLKRQVHVYARPGGKSSGTVWDAIKKEHNIVFHLGDSLHSDVAMAISRGHLAKHYIDSQLSKAEQAMMKFGQSELSCLTRALRLHNPYLPGSPEFALWHEQCQINVPFLIQASLYLNNFCQKHKKRRILFSSRDCCLWIQIFQKLFSEYDSIYFHASRFTYILPTPSYFEYVRSIYTDDTVIVDVHGSGHSGQKFFKEHFNLKPTILLIVNHGKKLHAILRTKTPREGIEMLNYALSGTLYDVKDSKPIRNEPEYDLRWIRPMHACVEKCIELISQYQFAKFDQRVVKWAIDSTKTGLVLNKYVPQPEFHLDIPKGEPLRRILHRTER